MKKRNDIKKLAARYVKLVEWSDEDQCYIGSAPPLVGQSCHGHTEEEVLRQLRVIVEDVIEMKVKYGDPLPRTRTDREFSGKFLLRVEPALHKLLALRAAQKGESLNEFCVEALKEAVQATAAGGVSGES
jgi:predicted HicB family RNase H-like nuclease